MAILFDSIPLNGVTPADLSQLLSYIEHRERDMWYYGNREQFEKRHEKLKKVKLHSKSQNQLTKKSRFAHQHHWD